MSFGDLQRTMDRAVLEHLGGPVTYTSAEGDTVEVIGIFDRSYVRLDAGEAGVSSTGPALFVRLEDLPADPETDNPTIMVDGTKYRVREVEPDGRGGVRLLMHVVG